MAREDALPCIRASAASKSTRRLLPDPATGIFILSNAPPITSANNSFPPKFDSPTLSSIARRTSINALTGHSRDVLQIPAMASSFKNLALRLPRATSSKSHTAVLRCCSKTPMSTAAPLQPSSRAISLTLHSSSLARSGSCRSMLPLVPRARATSPMTIASQARCFASAFPSATSSGASPRPSASPSGPTSSLDWDSFFKLRLRRRRIQLFFSVTTGLLGGAGGAILLSTGMAEPVVVQIPLDPFVTLGLMTLACAAMGWLIGPSIGNQVFYLMNHRLKAQMMNKETEFFARVKKNRVDPSNSSAGNPEIQTNAPAVPDFYGEKIQSVSGYRQWLKDQRAFNKKKTRAFV
ncbi:Presequence translocated-associated motor subunit pam17 [Metarhizium album ARSEF 1941]|uniref:Presequence translocated-associated motor subunit PAM17 n=1 Tax=Metarhizium album (strain ARSEF 1941) TaxID=1081103 RepID=A0A0B2WZT4_METAS|nr:Presequence translocated-associated motor subunit pam17 [Metarhizium album ARSEF 1941]KHN98947.1 Presequence translocated-associated motor subunit pam17 [Metarhizium album ARSEF 1941]